MISVRNSLILKEESQCKRHLELVGEFLSWTNGTLSHHVCAIHPGRSHHMQSMPVQCSCFTGQVIGHVYDDGLSFENNNWWSRELVVDGSYHAWVTICNNDTVFWYL